MKAYVAKLKSSDSAETIKNSGTADSFTKLSGLKSSSQKLYQAANDLKNASYGDNTKAEDLLDKAKNFVSQYNSVLGTTKSMNSYSILPVSYTHLDVYKRQSYQCDRIFVIASG